ncbi:MAG: DUF4214 domain-containing protein [Pseudomonadota bacterium]
MTTLTFTATGAIPSLNMISAGPLLPLFFNQGTDATLTPTDIDIIIGDSTTGLFPGTGRNVELLGQNFSWSNAGGKLQFTGGTLTDVNITVDGTNVLDISGASLDFAEFGGLLTSGSSEIFDYWLSGNDTINGGTGDDILVGFGGNSTLNGGGGNDVLFGENYGESDYDHASGQVVRLYQATLNRAPDDAGHSFWTNEILGGTALSQIAVGFVGSAEFEAVYGPSLTDSEFITLLYNNVLGRDPDSGGEAFWLGELGSGTSRADVVVGFSESPEFVNIMIPKSLEFSGAEAMGDFTDDIVRLYQATLDRLPDVGGFTFWVDGLTDGMTYLSAVEGFVNSPEFQAVYGTLTDAQFVNLLYNNVLGRDADPGGASFWEGSLAGGMSRAEVVSGFAQSAEFIDIMEPIVELWAEGLGTDDVLDGGAGDDVLVGGMLADEFHFNFSEGGDDLIADFEMWDTIVLEGFGLGSASAAAAAFVQDGNDAVYDHFNGEIRLTDVVAADLTSDEFQIA